MAIDPSLIVMRSIRVFNLLMLFVALVANWSTDSVQSSASAGLQSVMMADVNAELVRCCAICLPIACSNGSAGSLQPSLTLGDLADAFVIVSLCEI